MYVDGYKYWLAYKAGEMSYYRCCKHISSKCPARLVCVDGKKSQTCHNHPAEPNRAIIDKFRKCLTQRASTENIELYAIYCDEATNRHADAAMLYPFTAAESAMRKARRKQLPQTPSTVNDIIQVLDNSDMFRVKSGADKDALYQKTITVEDSICMIFMHRKTLDLFGRIEEVHVDDSFEFAAPNQPTYFFLTLHAVQGQLTSPVVYTVLTAKTQQAYSALFQYIKQEFNIAPNTITSGFDQMLQSSLSYIFPEATIKGNWFHYTDAVLNQMKQLSLQKETAKGMGASALRMILVLPLLPPDYMVPGLHALRKWMKEKTIFSKGLALLCEYVEQSWLRAVGTEKMSIFGTTRIASNHIKAFNKELADTIGSQNSVIWVILDAITQLATKIYVRLNRKMKSVASNKTKEARTRKRSELVSDTIIASATQLWIKTPVHLRNPLQFLQLSCHCINDAMYLSNLSDVKERNFAPNWAPLPGTVPSDSTSFLPTANIPQDSYNCGDIVINESNSTQQIFSSCFAQCSSKSTPNLQPDPDPDQAPACKNTSTSAATSSEPPPLVFFSSVKKLSCKRRLPLLSEPPPLVPIKTVRIISKPK